MGTYSFITKHIYYINWLTILMTHNSIDTLNGRKPVSHRQKIVSSFVIVLLLLITMNRNLPYHFSNIRAPVGGVFGQSGEPLENGSTNKTWFIDMSDVIDRSNEVISTESIEVNGSAALNWINITAQINRSVKVKTQGYFNLTNCNINLTGMLNSSGAVILENVNATVHDDINIKSNGILNITDSTLIVMGDLKIDSGIANLINSTIIINCSTLGEYFIGVENGGVLNILKGSNVTAPSMAQRVRVLWVSHNSTFYAEDSDFSFMGQDSSLSGITIDSNDTIIRKCSFLNNYYGVWLRDSSGAQIEDCLFYNNSVGLKLLNTQDNTVQDCTFQENIRGIYSENSGMNAISNCRFSNNSNLGVYLYTNSNNNTVEETVFENNLNGGIWLDNFANNNTISTSSLRNNSVFGIRCSNDSKALLITDCIVENNTYNLNFENRSTGISVINSTIRKAKIYDLLIKNSSVVNLLNSTFERDLALVDLQSNLTVQWFLHIYVRNDSLAALPDANVTIWDNANGSFELDTKTDANGWVRWVLCTEYYETGGITFNLTPHVVRSEKVAHDQNTTNVTINSSVYLIITLNQTILIAPDLVPVEKIDLSYKYPLRSQKINVTAKILNKGLRDFDNDQTNVSVYFYSDNTLINITASISSIPILGHINITAGWVINVTAGSHNISVVVDPDDNLTEINEENNMLSTTDALIVNSMPVAVLDVKPSHVLTYENIEFDASASYNDVDKIDLQDYFFDFGDGNTSGWISNNSIYHNYPVDGIYYGRVQVRDGTGLVSAWSTSKIVEILNRPPEANFNIEPASGTVETEFEFNPELSTDLDGVVVNYYWEFSDGNNSTLQKPKHKFVDDVQYSITLIVMDDDGEIGIEFTRDLKILNLPPIVTFNVSSINANVSEIITFNASLSTDPDDELDDLEFYWDFGDDIFGYNSSIIRHNFSKAGLYNVTVYVQDDDNATGEYTMQVNITEPQELETPNSTPVETDWFWLGAAMAITLVILFIIILLVLVTQTRRLRKLMAAQAEEAGKGKGKGESQPKHGKPEPDTTTATTATATTTVPVVGAGVGAKVGTGTETPVSIQVPGAGDETEFTTAGKLDFVILKKGRGKRFMKFELHQTSRSTSKFVGLIWRSAFFDKSWQMKENILGSKERVIDYLHLKILTVQNKNWETDYPGNGMIIAKPKTVETILKNGGKVE